MDTQTPIALELKVITMSDYFLEKFAQVIVSINERNNFLHTKFENDIRAGLVFERAVSVNAGVMSEDYNGGYWEFATAKENSKAIFMYLDDEKGYVIHNQNTQRTSAVDGRILGLMSCMMSFSHGSFALAKDHPKASNIFTNHYHALRNAFYKCVDELAYNVEGKSDATEEQIEEIKAMSRIVTSYLD